MAASTDLKGIKEGSTRPRDKRREADGCRIREEKEGGTYRRGRAYRRLQQGIHGSTHTSDSKRGFKQQSRLLSKQGLHTRHGTGSNS